MRAFSAALAEEHNIKLRQDMEEGQRSKASPAVSGELPPGEARQSFLHGMKRLSRPCVLGLILALCAYGAAGRLWMGYAVDHGMETWARCFRFTVPDRSHAYGCRLIESADSGRMAQLRALLAAGADVNARCDGFTPLDAAARSGNAEAVRLLLAAGADANELSALSRSPLHAAAEKGCAESVRLLLAAGAVVDAADAEGITPLFRAAERGHADAVRLLLEAHADVNAKNGLGWTALHEAVRLGHLDVAELLRAHGAKE